MKLWDILQEAKYDIHKSNMKIWFDECIRKFFPEFKNKIGSEWEYPTFVIKTDKNRAGWFKCSFIKDKVVNPIIGINPDFVEYTAKNITFHETIHYVQANTYGYTRYAFVSNGGHDSFFIEKMNSINSIAGSGFVTVKQETQSLGDKDTNKIFWVYGVMMLDGDFAFVHSVKLNESILQHLLKQKNNGRYKKVYSFQTKQFKYKIGSVSKTGLKLSIPNDQPAEVDLQQYEVS